MANDNLTWEIKYKPTALIKDSNSGFECQKDLIRVLLRSMYVGKHSDVITLFWFLTPKKTQGKQKNQKCSIIIIFYSLC